MAGIRSIYLLSALCTLIALTACSRAPTRGLAQVSGDHFTRAVKSFEERASQEDVGHPKHSSQLLHHGQKTKYVVVLTHGLFGSPHFLKGIAQELHARGMNVVMPRLTGHWSAEPEKLNEVPHTEWIQDQKEAIAYAKHFGEKLILAGYSTGGLLSVERVLSQEDEVHALLLWSPALRLTMKTVSASRAGAWLKISPDSIGRMPAPDCVNVPYISGQAGLAVKDLIQHSRAHNAQNLIYTSAYNFAFGRSRGKLYKTITTPVFLVDSTIDDVVAPAETQLFFESLGGPKVRFQLTDVPHGFVASGPEDKPTWPFSGQGYNVHFPEMTSAMHKFLDSLETGEQK